MKKTAFNINGEGMATNQPRQTDDSTLDSVHACQSATPHSHIPCKSPSSCQGPSIFFFCPMAWKEWSSNGVFWSPHCSPEVIQG